MHQVATTKPAALCGGDAGAARTVAVYRALLTGKGAPIEALGTPSLLYVSARWVDDSYVHPGAKVGVMSAAVQRCLVAGVPGLPRIVVVSGPEDPAIRTVKTVGIRDFADGAKLVTFGDVTEGPVATSYVTVDSGQGDVSGGRCKVRLNGDQVVSLSAEQQWIS